MEKHKDEAPAKKPIEFRRDPEDFATRYANNAYFESTIWDMKIMFGQTDVTQGQNVIIQHTAITLPWPYLKIFSYVLQTQIAAQEAEFGHISVPQNILTPPLEVLPEEIAKTVKHPKEQVAAIQKIWKEFIAANPELEQ
jgi:hypothetical protein